MRALVFAIALLGAGMHHDATAQPQASELVPEGPAGELLGRDPEPWRSYFLAARKAESIRDPLARCLAFPDLPGVQWPAGYGAMHCHYHMGTTLGLSEIEALLAAGDLATLEQRVRAQLARHETPGPEQEAAHRVFHQFKDDHEAGLRIAARWVELAPRSALAATALGFAHRGAGWSARGGRWSRETERARLDEMSRRFDLAEAQLRRAIGIEPRLLDPYISLVNMGKSDRGDVGTWAFERAQAVDPACGDLAYERMSALEPRWGGSQMEMLAYAARLEPHVAARPLLANQLSAPYADYVAMLEREARYTREAMEILESAVRRSGLEQALNAAASALLDPVDFEGDDARAVAMLLQHSRFQPVDAWANRAIAEYFVRRDPQWALAVLRRAERLEPDGTYLRYLFGAALYNTRQFDAAHPHYVAAAEDPRIAQWALRELGTMWLLDAGLEPKQAVAKARPYVERLATAHPDDPMGMYLRIVIAAVEGRYDRPMIERFVAATDGSEGSMAQRRAEMQKLLAALKNGSKSFSVNFD